MDKFINFKSELLIKDEQKLIKVILNCNESNVKFYEKCGYKKKEFEMVKYF